MVVRAPDAGRTRAADFEVTLSPRSWRADDAGNPEPDLAFVSLKRRFWRRNLGWSKGLVRAEDRADAVPLATQVSERHKETPTLSVPHREGNPDEDYDTSLVDRMDEKTPQFKLRNVDRYVMESDTDRIEWAESAMPDRRAYEKDLAEVRAARHEPPELGMADMAGGVVNDVRRRNRHVFRAIDWGEWLGQEHKRDSGGRLWTYKPPGDGLRTRPWMEIRIVEHKFWKGRLITEQY